jgi:hypothetical protein
VRDSFKGIEGQLPARPALMRHARSLSQTEHIFPSVSDRVRGRALVPLICHPLLPVWKCILAYS